MGHEGGSPVMGSVPFGEETPESWLSLHSLGHQRTQREATGGLQQGPHQRHPAPTHLQSCEEQTSVVSDLQSWYFVTKLNVPTNRPGSPLKISPYQTTCCSWTGWAEARRSPRCLHMLFLLPGTPAPWSHLPQCGPCTSRRQHSRHLLPRLLLTSPHSAAPSPREPSF